MKDNRVNGFDVAMLPNVRESISLTGQFAAVDEIPAADNLVLVAKAQALEDRGAIADDLLEALLR